MNGELAEHDVPAGHAGCVDADQQLIGLWDGHGHVRENEALAFYPGFSEEHGPHFSTPRPGT